MAKFEDYSDELDILLKSAEEKWTLNLGHIDFSDACQIIRLHIYHKFEKWDPAKGKFATWAKSVISNQLINIRRRVWGKFLNPCASCPFNLGDDLCSQNPSGKKNEECKLFRKWSKTRANGQNLNSAYSLDERFEDDAQELKIQVSGELIDITEATSRLHDLMLSSLQDKLKKFYEMKYIKSLPDESIALAFGFTTTEEGRAPGYRQIYHMEAEIKKLARFIVSTQDIF